MRLQTFSPWISSTPVSAGTQRLSKYSGQSDQCKISRKSCGETFIYLKRTDCLVLSISWNKVIPKLHCFLMHRLNYVFLIGYWQVLRSIHLPLLSNLFMALWDHSRVSRKQMSPELILHLELIHFYFCFHFWREYGPFISFPICFTNKWTPSFLNEKSHQWILFKNCTCSNCSLSSTCRKGLLKLKDLQRNDIKLRFTTQNGFPMWWKCNIRVYLEP